MIIHYISFEFMEKREQASRLQSIRDLVREFEGTGNLSSRMKIEDSFDLETLRYVPLEVVHSVSPITHLLYPKVQCVRYVVQWICKGFERPLNEYLNIMDVDDIHAILSICNRFKIEDLFVRTYSCYFTTRNNGTKDFLMIMLYIYTFNDQCLTDRTRTYVESLIVDGMKESYFSSTSLSHKYWDGVILIHGCINDVRNKMSSGTASPRDIWSNVKKLDDRMRSIDGRPFELMCYRHQNQTLAFFAVGQCLFVGKAGIKGNITLKCTGSNDTLVIRDLWFIFNKDRMPVSILGTIRNNGMLLYGMGRGSNQALFNASATDKDVIKKTIKHLGHYIAVDAGENPYGNMSVVRSILNQLGYENIVWSSQ